MAVEVARVWARAQQKFDSHPPFWAPFWRKSQGPPKPWDKPSGIKPLSSSHAAAHLMGGLCPNSAKPRKSIFSLYVFPVLSPKTSGGYFGTTGLFYVVNPLELWYRNLSAGFAAAPNLSHVKYPYPRSQPPFSLPQHNVSSVEKAMLVVGVLSISAISRQKCLFFWIF